MNKKIVIVIGIIIVIIAIYFLIGSQSADQIPPSSLETPIGQGETAEPPDTTADINAAFDTTAVEDLDNAFQEIDADINGL